MAIQATGKSGRIARTGFGPLADGTVNPPTMKKRITPRRLRALGLNPTEQLRLAVFVAGHRDWIARHAVSLETLLRRALHPQGMHLLRLQQAEPHPVYELWLRLAGARWQPNPKSSGPCSGRSRRRADP